MSEDNEPKQIKEFNFIKDIPTLLTVIDKGTANDVFHIINANWIANNTATPKYKEVSKVVFDLTGLYVKREGVRHVSHQPQSCIADTIENAFDALWNGEIDAVTIFHVPGLTLLNFCDPLPPINGYLQWELADIRRIVEAIRKAHADYFAKE